MHPRALVLLLMLCPVLPGPLCASEAVNPHWTGIHCTECHLSAQGGELRLGGDHIALCNRCHGVDGVSADPHPVAVQPQGPMQSAIPAAWPLQNNKITCLTCHEPLQQMTANLPLTLINPSFVRQPFSASPASFCFTCHQRERYRKKNPHLRQDGSGAPPEEQCLYCHPSVPDTRKPDAASLIALKHDETRLCGGCHPGKETDHPVRGNHLVKVPDTMRTTLDAGLHNRALYLPVLNNVISCSTCHNPHPEGVMQRPEVQQGSGEEYFLRGGKGKDLCLACHTEIKADPLPGWLQKTRADARSLPEHLVEHKPAIEQKCKACHAIDGPADGAQELLVLCFKTGCHETALLQSTHRHEISVLKQCTFCHNPHSSRYDNLLIGDEDSLCATCHPLLHDRGKTALGLQDHQALVSYAATLNIPPAYGCSFCHSINHKNDGDVVAPELCSQCHLYLRASMSVNAHRQVSEQSCTSCHDPHAAPYQPLLKEPRQAYKSFAPAPPIDQ